MSIVFSKSCSVKITYFFAALGTFWDIFPPHNEVVFFYCYYDSVTWELGSVHMKPFLSSVNTMWGCA